MSDEAASQRTPGVQSVDRAIAALEFLAAQGEAGVSELAADLDVHRSSAFRLLASLEQGGLVERVDDRGRYRLGLGLVALAGAVSAPRDVATVGRPTCAELANELGETVNIAVRDGCWAINVEQAFGPAAVGAHNWLGKRTPLHCTSSGKVLLAAVAPDERADLLVEAGEEQCTANTLTGAALAAALDRVVDDGYALAIEEYEEGLNAAAAPIRDRHGDVIAAISVSGPAFRLDRAGLEASVPPVVAAAAEISRRLGWMPG